MRKQKKRVIGAIALSAAMLATVCFSGCTPEFYSISKLGGNISGEVASNGGFVVEKGDYVYFINGKASYDDDNTFGEVEKGSLMRIAREDLDNGDYGAAETVVPLLFAAQNYDSGIYIYGDYVYFATPTTDTDKYGDVQNTQLDFKRAKLDGTETMGDYYFRNTDNIGEYRFVEVGEDKTVYCIYEEGTTLKSFNTKTEEGRTLVKGASDYFFDETVDEEGNKEGLKVYYTMSVTDKMDSDSPTAFNYNQVYCVTPDAYATVNEDNGSYTVHNAAGKNYRTYDFDKDYLEDNDEDFDAEDYTTYPYVNLGELVLDGIGSDSVNCKETMYNNADDVAASRTSYNEPDGYTYTIKSYQNNGLYFTRTKVLTSTVEPNLYYLADAKVDATTWNTVAGNFDDCLDVVADDTIDATKTLFTLKDGVHQYFYVTDSGIFKASNKDDVNTTDVDETVPIEIVTTTNDYSVSGATLLFLEGEYLYYYKSGSSNLDRINYTSSDKYDYQGGGYGDEEYQPSSMTQMQFNNSTWYKPEFVGTTLLYASTDTVGGVANYVYALDLAGSAASGVKTAAELNKITEQYDEVMEFINDVEDSAVKQALTYLFKANKNNAVPAAFTDVEDLYEDYQINEIKAFATRTENTDKDGTDYSDKFLVEGTADDYYDRQTYYVNRLGAMSSADAEKYADGLASYLKAHEVEETEESFPVWAIILICVAGALVVAAGITVPCVIVHKKRAKARADREATAVRRRKRIDTTDDKTIDVYADEKAEEAKAEEAQEQPAEEESAAEEQPVAEEPSTDEKTE
ncbi:MAG: hypothetical protein IJY11_02540 [Clostridia bacterium]|nr:hypothetical protein [Clostridia bacterium]